MPSKPFITNLRLLMAAGSMLGFVGGWGLLAQAGNLSEANTSVAAVVVALTTAPTSGSLIVTQPAATSTTAAVQATSAPAATATATPTATKTTTTITTTTKSTSGKLKTGGS